MRNVDPLPLFPLSDVVLLPDVSVPLFVFEPRYRQMTREALSGLRQIGMIAVRPEGVAKMEGNPPLFDVGCLGRITHAQERPDGTFQILLMGEHRFRIDHEHERTGDRLYRSARVQLLTDLEPSGEDEHRKLAAHRENIFETLTTLVGDSQSDESIEEQLEGIASLEPARLINALAQSITFASIERQQLLEANSIVARFQIMEDLLRFRMAERGAVPPGSPSLPN